MKFLFIAVAWSVGLLLVCPRENAMAEEKHGEMDNQKRSAYHQKRAEMLRIESGKCAEYSKKPDCPADKARAFAEMAGIMNEMAELNDQAAAALQKNDMAAYKAGGEKFKQLEAKKHALAERMGWNKPAGKDGAHPSHAAPGGKPAGMDVNSVEGRRKLAETLRKAAGQCVENSRKPHVSADKSKAYAEMAGVVKEMAGLHDRAADALQKNDSAALKSIEERFRELEPRKKEIYQRLGWPGESKDAAHAPAEKKDHPSSSTPAESSKGGSEKTSGQGESDLQRWLAE